LAPPSLIGTVELYS